MKVPSRLNPRKRYWKPRTDRRNEALDCTVYALYLSRHLRLHLRRAVQWDIAELRMRQGDLLDVDADHATEQPHEDHQDETVLEPTLPASDSAESPLMQADESAVTAQLAAARFAALMRSRREHRHGR
jgi:phage terminase large subunit GpA-like protein